MYNFFVYSFEFYFMFDIFSLQYTILEDGRALAMPLSMGEKVNDTDEEL